MKKHKLSPWHDMDKLPVRYGVYGVTGRNNPCDNYGPISYQYWNGKWWGLMCSSPIDAYKNRNDKSLFQDSKWRGILKD